MTGPNREILSVFFTVDTGCPRKRHLWTPDPGRPKSSTMRGRYRWERSTPSKLGKTRGKCPQVFLPEELTAWEGFGIPLGTSSPIHFPPRLQRLSTRLQGFSTSRGSQRPKHGPTSLGVDLPVSEDPRRSASRIRRSHGERGAEAPRPLSVERGGATFREHGADRARPAAPR